MRRISGSTQTRLNMDRKLERHAKEISLLVFMPLYFVYKVICLIFWCIFAFGILLDECYFENEWPWERVKKS